jgi:polysaccharide pyruvyl transferase WcaK-like protein
MQGALLEELQRYNWISARESITADALKAKGLKQVSLYPDPAFTLGRKKTAIPSGFVEGNTVGINISPMILHYGEREDTVLLNYSYLIERILQETDMAIALIPHVVRPQNDDRKPLSWLYEKFKETERVFLVSDRPAEELKEIISRCRFMVAARTHASIAGYSESVPTLAVGYSVKARGIARDIFGTENRFVLPVQSMKHHDKLWSGFQWLMAEENTIRGKYQEKMADYIEKAVAAGRCFMGK